MPIAATFKTQNFEERKLELSFGLLLADAFTRGNELAGRTTVRLLGRNEKPIEKPLEGAFLFVGLPPGAYTVQVRSNEPTMPSGISVDWPFYLATDLPINLPMPNPLWPAYPDVSLANPNLPLDDPGQPAAYQAQRRTAALKPTTCYPFPEGTTLVRGTVRSNNRDVPGALVQTPAAEHSYVTGLDGEFVLFFKHIRGSRQDIVLQTTHPQHPLKNTNVTLQRGMTVVSDINLP